MAAIRKLCPELQQKAIDELNEEPPRIPKDLKQIKEWLAKQSYITARTDDQLLIAFLRGGKFSLERTKEKIDAYYTYKTLVPEIFDNNDPLKPEIQEVLEKGLFLPLPVLETPDAPRYTLMRVGSNLKLADIFSVIGMVHDILIQEDDNFNVSGVISIVDMKHSNMQQILQTSPSLIKKSMTAFQKGYPTRLRGVHFVNTSQLFESGFALFSPFLSAKTKSRISVHSSYESALKVIPKSVLPEEYQGEGGKLDEIAAEWKRKVENYREFFLQDKNYRTNEKKRPGKPKTEESVFGVDGSFRQLAID